MVPKSLIIARLILLKFASKFDLAFYYSFVWQNVWLWLWLSLSFSDLRLLVLFHSWAPGCAPLDSLACCYHQGALSMRVSRKGQVVSALEADWLELTAAYYRKGWSLVDSFIYWDTPKGSSLTSFDCYLSGSLSWLFIWLPCLSFSDCKRKMSTFSLALPKEVIKLHFLQVHLFILRSYVLHPPLFKPATSLSLTKAKISLLLSLTRTKFRAHVPNLTTVLPVSH